MSTKPVDTIAAIATPLGHGGIGIIRMSGPKGPAILDSLWKGVVPCSQFETHKLYRGAVRESPEGKPLDHVVACWMKSPRSYTGEDVVEIHAHGGPYLLEMILEGLLRQGARLAQPGEFTQRSFTNGKIDLTQAEAIADLIAAQSQVALRVAERQLTGKLSSKIRKLREQLLEIRVALEGEIDFSGEDDVAPPNHESLVSHLQRARTLVDEWLSTYEEGRAWREGLVCVLVRRPNVGKSSLLNALLSQDRALVHPLPGTTRDTVEETLLLGGMPIRLIDTAGLHPSDDTVELAGQARSRKKIEECDLCLWVVDGSEALTPEDDFIFEAICNRPFGLIINKIDKGLRVSVKDLAEQYRPQSCYATSALQDEGIGEVKTGVQQWAAREGKALSADVVINNRRHQEALLRCAQALAAAQEGLEQKTSVDLIADDLLIATKALGEITGEITTEEVLGEIFSRFCVGK